MTEEGIYGVRADAVPVNGRPRLILHADESISLGKVDDVSADTEGGSSPVNEGVGY